MTLLHACEHSASGASVSEDLAVPGPVSEVVEEEVFESKFPGSRRTADHRYLTSCEGGERRRSGGGWNVHGLEQLLHRECPFEDPLSQGVAEGLVNLAGLCQIHCLKRVDMFLHELQCPKSDSARVEEHLTVSGIGRNRGGERRKLGVFSAAETVISVEGEGLDEFPSPETLVEDAPVRVEEGDVGRAEHRRAHDVDVVERRLKARDDDAFGFWNTRRRRGPR